MFSTRLENFLSFLSNLKLSSANSYNLEESKICRLGKGYQVSTILKNLYLLLIKLSKDNGMGVENTILTKPEFGYTYNRQYYLELNYFFLNYFIIEM